MTVIHPRSYGSIGHMRFRAAIFHLDKQISLVVDLQGKCRTDACLVTFGALQFPAPGMTQLG